MPQKDGSSALREAQRDITKHQSGRIFLTALLQEAKSEIARDGYISSYIRWQVFMACSYWDYCFGRACLDCGPQEAKTGDRASEQAVDEQAAKEHIDRVAAAIDDRLEKISQLKVYEIDREYLARDAEARSFSLPPADATDKLLRYEAHLDRQLYRAMDQLERIQRQRRGENVPPPLNINLGRRR